MAEKTDTVENEAKKYFSRGWKVVIVLFALAAEVVGLLTESNGPLLRITIFALFSFAAFYICVWPLLKQTEDTALKLMKITIGGYAAAVIYLWLVLGVVLK